MLGRQPHEGGVRGQRLRVGLPDPEIGVDQVHSQRRFVEHRWHAALLVAVGVDARHLHGNDLLDGGRQQGGHTAGLAVVELRPPVVIERGHDEVRRPRLGQLEFDRVVVADIDVAQVGQPARGVLRRERVLECLRLIAQIVRERRVGRRGDRCLRDRAAGDLSRRDAVPPPGGRTGDHVLEQGSRLVAAAALGTRWLGGFARSPKTSPGCAPRRVRRRT
mgnify:CR=1 FL=1